MDRSNVVSANNKDTNLMIITHYYKNKHSTSHKMVCNHKKKKNTIVRLIKKSNKIFAFIKMNKQIQNIY